MSNEMQPRPTGALAGKRAKLAPEIHGAFQRFQERVFADGALLAKAKQLIAVVIARVIQSLYRINRLSFAWRS